ncbi:MAG: MBL fold metallo-hydrolase, partial [Planococcus donghaensis]
MLKVYEHEQVVCIEGILEETRSKVFLFLVDGMLIDTGAEKMQDDLKEELAKLSFDQVVLTHHHEDHTGNAAWIQQHFQVPFYIHPSGQEITDKDGV